MRFTTWDGIEVVYEDGALSGDEYFISEINAAVDDQELCGCDYWRAEPASLESDWSAYLTICGTIKRLTGSEPEVDRVPTNPEGYVPEGPVIDRSLMASACELHGEFACNSRACAPPPVGRGGSLPSGISTTRRGRSPLGGSADHETVREYVDGLANETIPVWRAVTGRLGSTPDKLNPFNEETKVAAKIESNSRIIGKLKGSKQFQRGLKDLLDRKVSDIVGTVTSDKDMIADVLHLAVRQGTDMRYTYASPVNPNETVRELLTRLSNGEFFDETEYGTNKLKGLSPEDILTASLTRMFVDGWARSSNDSDPRSISKQMAAAELHGFDYERFYTKEYKHHGSLVPKDILDDARRQLNRDRDLLQALTKAEYEATQEFLKEAGIKTVTVFRGTKVEWDKLPMRGEVVDTESNPLSSWSTDVATARDLFGRGVGDMVGGMTIAMDVPAEMIQSTTVTGRGCLVEYEVLVIGYPSKALVTSGKDNFE